MILAALALSLSLNASAAPAPKAAPAACKPQKVAKKAKLTFPDGKTILANIVDTPASRETGMM
ncbi:MAG: hypothetical protein ACHQ51_14330, partial [Elusimicrobiota bacterium]